MAKMNAGSAMSGGQQGFNGGNGMIPAPAFSSGINPPNPLLQIPQLTSFLGNNPMLGRAIMPSPGFVNNPSMLNPNAGFAPPVNVPPLTGMRTTEPVPAPNTPIAPSDDFLQKIAQGHNHGFMV